MNQSSIHDRPAVDRSLGPAWLWIAIGVCLALSWHPATLHAQPAVDWIEDVQPILSTRCFSCHGADAEARQAELRLDIPPGASGESAEQNRAIVPYQPNQSELVARITSQDPALKMPPPDSGHVLTDGEILILQQWIAAGAKYRSHWSFIKPERPEVPQDAFTGWCRNPIDHFIARQLAAHDLTPAPAANPRSLIRRVYLDLTGLPPSPQVVDEFASDPSDAAYEAIVDDLLQSPGFGEHWARMWLDLARYADTKGYEKDQPRTIWRYRDWVIESLNADMPFDQFTREQLAGDLLPNATSEQILATAFHRNTMTNDEGGTDNEEFRVAAVKDRVDTTVQVWMGLTMGCAKCHTHKYDPITQREYYQFLAYFNQTQDEDRPDDNPRLATPTAEQSERLQNLGTQLAEVTAQLQAPSDELAQAQKVWEDQLAEQSQWQALLPVSAQSANGSGLRIQPDRSVLAQGPRPATDVYTIRFQQPLIPTTATPAPKPSGQQASTDQAEASGTPTWSAAADAPIRAIRLEALTHASLPKQGPGRTRSDPNFVLNEFQVVVVRPDGTSGDPLPLCSALADFSQDNWPVANAIDGDVATGWAISPQQGQPHVAIFELADRLQLQAGEQLQVTLSQQYSGNSLLLGCVRVSTSAMPWTSLKAELQTLAERAAIPADQRSSEQQDALQSEFRKSHAATAPLWKEVQRLQAELDEMESRIPQTPVMRDREPDQLRSTFVHVRGNFLDPGELVEPALPAALTEGSMRDDDPGKNRLTVANWLVSESNPLTSRVMVNRLWARLFGRGIVETEEDFGIQGALPTHPQLLDWLATEFRVTHQWSIKQILKTMVTSATYRQSNEVTAVHKERDPDNHWLSRSPRFRLSAEVIRDQALSISGLLSHRLGGASVMPPQPEGIWKATYSTLKWETAENEDRYRRGLYTFLRRTSPYPSMITFDGGSGEVCQIRRIRTNTPLQALVTLNDPVFIEAAGALASRAMQSPADNTTGENPSAPSSFAAQVIGRMFHSALLRPPAENELARLKELYVQVSDNLGTDATAVSELLQSARLTATDMESPTELASHVIIASVILNLDELLMRP